MLSNNLTSCSCLSSPSTFSSIRVKPSSKASNLFNKALASIETLSAVAWPVVASSLIFSDS